MIRIRCNHQQYSSNFPSPLSPNISPTFSYFWPAKYECIMINDRYGNFRPQTEYSILHRPRAKRAWLFKLEPTFILMYSSSMWIQWGWLKSRKVTKSLKLRSSMSEVFTIKRDEKCCISPNLPRTPHQDLVLFPKRKNDFFLSIANLFYWKNRFANIFYW